MADETTEQGRVAQQSPDQFAQVVDEVRQHRLHVRRLNPPTPAALLPVIDGTVMSLLQDVAELLRWLRDFTATKFEELEGRADEAEERLEDIESDEEATEMPFTPEEYDEVIEVLGAAKALALERLGDATLGDEARSKLNQTMEKADRALAVMSRLKVVEEEGDDDEEEKEEADQAAVGDISDGGNN